MQSARKIIRYGYNRLDRARTDEDKISAIVNMCRQLEVAHLFRDGNQRTMAVLVLNKLLVDHKLSPTCLDDPYMFDGTRSVAEMVKAVQVGQRTFRSVKATMQTEVQHDVRQPPGMPEVLRQP